MYFAATSGLLFVLADGWAQCPSPDHLALTDEGRDRLVKVAAQVNTFREVSLTGITDDEYRTAVSVLERITQNLESRA
ncbi:hypothetical protein [Nocardia sp. NBC_01388]|uniref:hypothetical protein n=1 Tax=Nocardia sp. NBC_01388 TaxID=2903596 RepID=UPI00324CD49F